MKQRFKQAGMWMAIPVALDRANAQAQSASQFYGVLDVWAGPSQTSNAGASAASVNSGGMQTSFCGPGGSDPLVPGVKVIYALESYVQVDSGTAGRAPNDALFARNAYVGLQTRYGEVKLGRVLNPVYLATAQANRFGGSIRLAPLLAQMWGPATGRAVYGDTSWDNALVYNSPQPGKFKAAVYGALGVAPRARAKTGQLGVSVAAGSGNILASWARTSNASDRAPACRRDTGAFGYNYSASPRTELYAVPQRDRLSTANRARTCGLGIRHKF